MSGYRYAAYIISPKTLNEKNHVPVDVLSHGIS